METDADPHMASWEHTNPEIESLFPFPDFGFWQNIETTHQDAWELVPELDDDGDDDDVCPCVRKG